MGAGKVTVREKRTIGTGAGWNGMRIFDVWGRGCLDRAVDHGYELN